MVPSIASRLIDPSGQRLPVAEPRASVGSPAAIGMRESEPRDRSSVAIGNDRGAQRMTDRSTGSTDDLMEGSIAVNSRSMISQHATPRARTQKPRRLA